MGSVSVLLYVPCEEALCTHAHTHSPHLLFLLSPHSAGIKHRKNEIFLDVVEKLNLLVSSNGTVLHSEIIGSVQMKSFLSGETVEGEGSDRYFSCPILSFLYLPLSLPRPFLPPSYFSPSLPLPLFLRYARVETGSERQVDV